ncbi:peptidase domain-containing ABC transporter [Iningainema tapete]|uniref:Peptidase domain-containing ABC transporter n=1 Tax=Iningainema tapete BLCC-T55 TaxID=2748662 RepID=A0A8J7C9G9_9CYAN|nr:peptidase domain-containing ABC transporter [Iningainema tapete]MBD2778094.1 peptidase domain-containing ABC transporter [Iningainema tapete BLCC-T55]
MKYQVVLQHSEEDCGAACLAAIAKYYGQIFSLSRAREVSGTGTLGTTLLNLRQGAQALGFDTRGVKVTLELVDQKAVPLPGIIHWLGNHWVVLYGRVGRKYAIADPASGMRYLSQQELLSGWKNGAMLLLVPRPDFLAQPDDRNKIGSFRRLLLRCWNYRHILVEALLINLFIGLLSLSFPFLLQILTDDVLIQGDNRVLTGIAIAVLLMNLISSLLRLVQSNLVAHFAQRLELDLVLEFGRAILGLPLSYYESHRSGEVVSRLRDIEQLNQLLTKVGVTLPSQLFVAVTSFFLMLFYSPKLVMVSMLIVVVMCLSTVVFLPTLQQKIRDVLLLAGENQGILVETFKGALPLKAMNAAPHFWEEFQSRYGRQAHLTFRTIQIVIINNTFFDFVSKAGGIILLWFGSTLVISQQLSIGQLIAFNSLNGNILIVVSTLLGFVDQFTRAKAATGRLTEVIDSTREAQDDVKKPFAEIPGDADIICSNLNFYHPGRVDLLKDFSLTIPGGKAIALIGKSGCGKSTLAKLIAGLYQPQSGNIRINCYNLPDLSLSCIRQQVVLIPQDAHFWSRSIIDNLRLGYENITFAQIVQACQIADADDFISKLPNKYQTVLGEFGANLSGGQKQRLAIARGIVTDPPILILDESTAALDPVSEAQILERLLSHRQGKTTILISHRPRVINRADWIVLLEEGIVIQGNRDELYNISGNHLDFLIP